MIRFTQFFIALLLIGTASPAFAGGANEFVSAPGVASVGDSLSASIYVNTNGQSANSFEATISWPSFLTPITGHRGSICSFYIDEPSSPSGSSGSLSCGKSNGYTGSGGLYSISFTASSSGSGSFGLSGCTVLANDGNGTNITGGCSGSSITVNSAAQAPPPATVTNTSPPTSQASGSTSTTAKATPKPTTKPNQTPTPAESAATPTPSTVPTPPPIQALPASTPLASSPPTTGNVTTSSAQPVAQQRRSIGKAFSDLISSLKQIKLLPKDGTGAVALILTTLPALALLLATVYFIYRLYLLETRRKRAMNRLFELELSELSSLEGKMDLLVEKGAKGRQQYTEEFEKTKQHILQQIRPDYGKPVDPLPNPQ